MKTQNEVRLQSALTMILTSGGEQGTSNINSPHSRTDGSLIILLKFLIAAVGYTWTINYIRNSHDFFYSVITVGLGLLGLFGMVSALLDTEGTDIINLYFARESDNLLTGALISIFGFVIEKVFSLEYFAMSNLIVSFLFLIIQHHTTEKELNITKYSTILFSAYILLYFGIYLFFPL